MVMVIDFTKMHGLGNDFVVIDAINQKVSLEPDQVRCLADRHFGVGFDQLLLVEKAQSAEADFRYRIFNADGGEVEQCGNGARCFARFVRDHGLSDKDEIVVETLAGIIKPKLESDGQITVNMGVPIFEPAAIPFKAEVQTESYVLDLATEQLPIYVLSMGNPHVVQFVEDVDQAPVSTQGPKIESHPNFPNRVNAGYAQVLDKTHMRVRVHERGVGETLACGSGACAAMVSARRQGLVDEEVEVSLAGGALKVRWLGDQEPVWLTGPVTTVFEGSFLLDRL